MAAERKYCREAGSHKQHLCNYVGDVMCKEGDFGCNGGTKMQEPVLESSDLLLPSTKPMRKMSQENK